MFIKKLIIFLISATSLFAQPFGLNDNIVGVTIQNQFEKDCVIDAKIQRLIVSFEKDISENLNKFLATKKPDFLKERQTLFIANISKMPSIIASLFAIPKMQKYKYDILLINDEDDKRFASKESKVTIYEIKNGIIEKIDFNSSKEVIENILK